MTDAKNFLLMLGARGFIHPVEEAPAYWMEGILWTMLADAEDIRPRAWRR